MSPNDALAERIGDHSADAGFLLGRMSGVCENEKVFGSALDAPLAPLGRSYPPEELDTEFKKKYPPDPFGEEMTPNARVWNIFRDEATVQDESMLDGWNKTLDILLIFAGLFSAVATAFIVESYKFLEPDFEEYTARALFVLMSTRNGSGILDGAQALPDPSFVSATDQSR